MYSGLGKDSFDWFLARAGCRLFVCVMMRWNIFSVEENDCEFGLVCNKMQCWCHTTNRQALFPNGHKFGMQACQPFLSLIICADLTWECSVTMEKWNNGGALTQAKAREMSLWRWDTSQHPVTMLWERHWNKQLRGISCQRKQDSKENSHLGVCLFGCF